jgi:DNA-directed RNA polymerase subunit RPC12/RpoP
MDRSNNTRAYYGNIYALDLARALKAAFHRGNYAVQTYGKPEKIILQISTHRQISKGGQTALTVHLTDIPDGVMVSMQQQKWLGVAASLGVSALATAVNPWNLLSRIDDIAQDIESLNLIDDIWKTIEQRVHLAGASTRLSQKLARVTCPYCYSAIQTGESQCTACGAPLGEVQPYACPHCGFLATPGETVCRNCHQPL